MPFVPNSHRARVRSVESLGEAMRAVTLEGPGLQRWRSCGRLDEWVHLQLPDASRLYTVRAHRSDPVEVRLEISLHSSGPAARWAASTRVGDEISISQPVGRHAPPPDTRWQLVAADHAGLPAAARITQQAPPGQQLIVCLAVDDLDDYPWPSSSAQVSLHRVVEPDPDRAAALLGALVRSLDWPDGPGYVWLGAEAACARALRRHLRRERGWPSDRFDVVGYWQRRSADYERRYAAVADQVAALFTAGQAGGSDPDDVLLEVEDLLDAHGL